MNFIKQIKKIKENNSRYTKPEPTFAKLHTKEGYVELEMDGTAILIEVYYRGSIYVDSTTSFGFKHLLNKNKVTIINLFGAKEFLKSIFLYSGVMNVLGCVITTYDGRKIKPTIVSDDAKNIINKQKTTFETADEVLFYSEEPEENYTNLPRGVSRNQISERATNQDGKFQKFEKETIQSIASQIKTYASLVEPARFSQKTQLPQRTKRPIAKPIVRAPRAIKGRY